MNMFTDGYMRSLLAAAVCLMLSLARAQLPQVQVAPKVTQSEVSGALEQVEEAVQAQRRSVFAPITPKTTTPTYPTSSQIQTETDAIEIQRKGLFSDDNAATHHAPRIFPNVTAAQPNQIDIEALARRYQNKAQSSGSGDDLMVFASFSMPTPSLRTLVASVSSVGGRVVLRGFKNDSYRQTLQAIASLGVPTASVSVNPKAFDQYQIMAVPAFVLAKRSATETLDTDGCSLPENFVAISGDVSLAYALREMASRSAVITPDLSALATRYLRQMGPVVPEVSQ
ncbi:MAG: type-F conjugative transfer system pilin assembly protein TrbC [Rhodoferax sp.]|jgi:conjugal transfer pilus assembly protein TrbC|uniref:type-F conjugative transfer system pilin assembly protein TrbC n=1 Tax=Rhodoferax sp. TaxID=50421 RepID=UPI001B61EF31|nr:type-F conjugative transfer system pilin assembly protein TrbC [Rhodoferax sp.]MBP8285272.1 type-F conjugative transfer system pilin assembly protein TrbC [Rhodoferax sp.]MBP9149067.1 type-F conjugative transfer system pilin assembly protein TrbC [Rhodoferax sp.]MBP9736962.1 type-F conjugative transfer system pilin assembly protein TrbC [Rhodoferax sp.]